MKTEDVKNIDEVRKHSQWYEDYTLQEMTEHTPVLGGSWGICSW
jgi:hypothetical protein